MPQINLNDFFRSSKAYLIAVGDYKFPSIANLNSPKRDVAALKEVLEQHHGFTIPPLTLPNPLINPDSSQLLDFLDAIAAQEDDRVILYFAGHGIAMDSEGEPEGYLLATDAEPGNWNSFIKMSEVLKRIGGMKARHLLIVLDCCYSGAFRWAQHTRGPGSDVPKTIYYERFSLYAKNKAWQVLTSSAHDQKAIDTLRLGKREQEGDGSLSPFAQILVDALKTGEADMRYGNTKPDGVITVTELSFYLQNRIFEQLYNENIKADKQQVPSLFPITDPAAGNYGSGEFVFLNPSQVIDNAVRLLNSTHTNPYKGLESYGRGDDKIFYGRQRVLDGWQEGTADYIGLIAAAKKYQVLIVTGPSGIGKSSLVKAGLLSLFPEKDVVDIRPGKTPFQQHEIKLAELNHAGSRKVLLIDQFEELITVCDSEEERRKFEMAVAALAEKHLVILTVRSDFENQFKDSPLLAIKDTGKKYRFIVPPFSREEIQQVVTQPAAQESLEFKPHQNGPKEAERFINNIVDEAFQNPGSMPLLSMALSELWDKKEGNNLLEAEYIKFGGLGGILDKKFTKEYDALADDAQGQRLFQQLVFRMISFEGARTSKRSVYTKLDDPGNNPSIDDELRFSDNRYTAQIKEIASKLVEARLLRADKDEFEKPYIEPSHDALLRTSSLVAKWIKPMQEKIQLHKSVSDVSISYQHSSIQERKDYLNSWANHPRLLEAKREISGWLNSIEEDFIHHAYARKIRVKKVRNWTFGIVGTIITCLAVFAGIQAVQSAREAKKNKALYLAAESDKFGATEKLSLLKRAYAIHQDTSIYQKMQALFNQYDYYNPFAIAKWDAKEKDSIDNMAFDKHLSGIDILLKGGKRVTWDFVKDSALNDITPHPLNYSASSDGVQVYVLDHRNYKVQALAYTSLDGSHVQADSGYIDLLVADSNHLTYVLRLDSNMQAIYKKQLTLPADHELKYLGAGYFAVSEFSANSYLYNARGELIDTRPPNVNIIGLQTINGKLVELLLKEDEGLALAEVGSSNPPRFFPAPVYINYGYTAFGFHPLQDSAALVVVYNPPLEGPGGQSTELYVIDLKANRLKQIFRTNFSFNTFELSADSTMAIGTSEKDSCYIFDLKQQRLLNVTRYDGLENAVFRGDNNVYCITAKSAVGYTTAVRDSAGNLLNTIEYSYQPLSIAIGSGNKFISMLFPGSSILVWELHPAFNPRPWGDELDATTSSGSFEVSTIRIDSPGLFIEIDASISAGQPINYVYYHNYKLHTFNANDDSAMITRPVPKGKLLEYSTFHYPDSNKTIRDFIYGEKKWNQLFTGEIKSLTGYDLNSKDSLKGFLDKNFIIGEAFGQFFLLNEGVLFLFDRSASADPDPFSPGEVAGGALFDAGNNVLMVTKNGTVYIKRTRRYMDSFIANGYTIPPNPLMWTKIKV